ncbi:MAG: hypothetical protein R3338_01815 [Thermoanaerobaculia bacterium]|nr:hypothetical protein [Thermoanaerobaculia bacterium]
MKRAHLTILLVFVAGQIAAQPVPPPPSEEGWCGTSSARTEELKALHEWRSERRVAMKAAVPGPRVVRRDGLFIVEADEAVLANDDLLDLVGRTLRLHPGPGGFDAETVPLDDHDDVGELVVDFSLVPASPQSTEPTQRFETIDLPFSFPFFGGTHDELFLTEQNGIYFSTPVADRPDQYETEDAVSIAQPMISPLLLPRLPRAFAAPRVYANVMSDEVVITWQSDSEDFAYDVQARLRATGAIDLSWRSARSAEWGAVVVTPGLGGAGIERQSLLTLEDSPLDAEDEKPFHDLTRIGLERLAGTDLLHVRIRVYGPIDRDQIGDGQYLQYGLDSSAGSDNLRVAVHLTRDQESIFFTGRGWISNPGSLEISENEISFLMSDQDLAAGDEVTLNGWVWESSESRTVDSVAGSHSISRSSKSFELDLDSSGSRFIDAPLIETFTLPDMDPFQVWDLISAEFQIDAAGPDALAIYQNFFTDLILFASAYSTVGNPAVDGIAKRPGFGSTRPAFPALLHMNRLGYRLNASEESAIHVLNHEFGHRWLYFFEIVEDGKRTRSLNPAGAHPAQYVHTPAAFDLLGSQNSSAMGGSWFQEVGDGLYRARDPLAPYGFSWHELYLMGLAGPEEVEPWFYIADSDPELGDAYYPPDGIVVSGERRDVTIDQLIDAMGPRVPGVDSSRKRFQVYFVLLVRDLDEVTEEEIEDLGEKRQLLRSAIPAATGGRGSVDTVHGDSIPRRRGIRRP